MKTVNYHSSKVIRKLSFSKFNLSVIANGYSPPSESYSTSSICLPSSKGQFKMFVLPSSNLLPRWDYSISRNQKRITVSPLCRRPDGVNTEHILIVRNATKSLFFLSPKFDNFCNTISVTVGLSSIQSFKSFGLTRHSVFWNRPSKDTTSIL